VIQDFDKNKPENSQVVANNVPYILKEMWGEKEIWKATNSIQNVSLTDKGTTTIQSRGMNAYQSEPSLKERIKIVYNIDILYENHPIMMNIASCILKQISWCISCISHEKKKN
jgi:hypothetical protein